MIGKNFFVMFKTSILGNISVLIILWLTMLPLNAQEAGIPKWGNKVQKGIVSVLTYDKDNNLLKSGTGFYISNDGIGIADYSLFYNAYSAIVVDSKGVKSKVVRILGADDTYSLVKFQVNSSKTTALTQASSKAEEGAVLFALKYSKDKLSSCPTARVSGVKAIGSGSNEEATYPFYTLSYAIDESYLGAPLFNANGELIATVQPSMGLNGYALGIQFINSLKIQAISSKANNIALDKIHIPKGLPDTMEESLVYLYRMSYSLSNDDYLDLLNQFVSKYPDNAEGYYRRATPLIDTERFDDANRDLTQYYKLSTDKAVANARIADIIYSKLLYQPTPAYSQWTYDTAIGYIDKALDLSPDNLSYKLLKARILMSKRDFSEALNIYDELNSSDSRSAATLFAACLAHEGLGDTATIQIELLDSAIALFPTPLPTEAADYVLRRGQLYARIGKYREAVSDYNQYAYLNSSKVNDTFYYDRSQLEVKARMYQQALDDLNKAIELSPRMVLYYVEKSGLLLRVNEIEECIAAADQAIAMAPDNADAYRIKGYAQIQKGDKEAGKASLQKAIDLGDELSKELMNEFVK